MGVCNPVNQFPVAPGMSGNKAVCCGIPHLKG